MAGDRQRAVVDPEAGVSLSAKSYAELLTCQARTIDGEVFIEFSDGSKHAANSKEASEALSDLLKREVIIQAIQDGQIVRHEFPGEPVARFQPRPHLSDGRQML